MTPTGSPDTAEMQGSATGSIAVQLALLTGKVEQVIGDHERRISTLEARRDGSGTRVAGIVSPYIAGVALVVLLAGKVSWAP